MTTPEELREWLKKMQFHNCNVQEETLEKLCRGDLCYIFRQIIDKIKPREEIEKNNKAAIVHYLLNKNTISDRLKPEKVKLYEEKIKLEKELSDVRSRKDQGERSLNILINKVTSINMKVRLLKEQIKKNERDNVLYRIKCEEIDQQMEIAQKLYEDAEKLVPIKSGESTEEVEEKVSKVVTKLSEIINENKAQISIPRLECKKEFKFSITEPLSSKMHLSTISKKPTYQSFLNSTPNDISKYGFGNMSMCSTISAVCPTSTNDTVLSQDNTDKSLIVLKDILSNFWKNTKIKDDIEELWNSGCDVIKQIITETKKENKEKLLDSILYKKADSISMKLGKNNVKKIEGIENLYAILIDKQLLHLKLQHENKQLQTLAEKMSGNIPYLSALKMTEAGIQAMNNFIREKIKFLQNACNKNSDEVLCKTLSDIQKLETNMTEYKIKIDTLTALLRTVDDWFDKLKFEIQSDIQDIYCVADYMHQSRAIFEEIDAENTYYPSYMSAIGDMHDMQNMDNGFELLKTDFVSRDIDNFITLSYYTLNNQTQLEWGENCDPEFMELVQKSYLSADGAIRSILDEKLWLKKLESFSKKNNKTTFTDIVPEDLDLALQLTDMKTKSALENLEKTKYNYMKIKSRCEDHENEISFLLQASLNDYVAQNILYEGKTLKEYLAMYDNYFSKLKE